MVTVGEIRKNLAEYMSRAQFGNDLIGITRHGKVAAVLTRPSVLGSAGYTSLVTAAEFRNAFAEHISQVQFGSQRIGITRHGKVAAVLISTSDLQSASQ